VVSALSIAALASLFVWRSRQRPVSAPAASASSTTSQAPPARGAERVVRRPSAQERSEARARRDALHAEIVRVLAALPPAPAAVGPEAAPPAPGAPKVYPPGDLRDRIGGRDALIKSLNRDFMPLAQECIERAQERSPALKGMLALSLETLSDGQLGAVVDVAEAAPDNEVAEPELLECIRETAYSLRLPPPRTNGREKFLLTLPVEPAADLGPAR
jgi:hypothetical protein